MHVGHGEGTSHYSREMRNVVHLLRTLIFLDVRQYGRISVYEARHTHSACLGDFPSNLANLPI